MWFQNRLVCSFECFCLQFATIKCDLEAVHHISTTNQDLHLKVFLDEELFSPTGNLALLLDNPRDVALIEGCPGHWFLARTEPTADGTLGFSIVTPNHRTRFIGRGDVVNIDGEGHKLYVTFQTVFPLKVQTPREAQDTGAQQADQVSQAPQVPQMLEQEMVEFVHKFCDPDTFEQSLRTVAE